MSPTCSFWDKVGKKPATPQVKQKPPGVKQQISNELSSNQSSCEHPMKNQFQCFHRPTSFLIEIFYMAQDPSTWSGCCWTNTSCWRWRPSSTMTKSRTCRTCWTNTWKMQVLVNKDHSKEAIFGYICNSLRITFKNFCLLLWQTHRVQQFLCSYGLF